MVVGSSQQRYPNRRASIATALLLTIGLSSAATLIPTHPASARAQDPENGRYLYSWMGCIDCHGLQAEGDGDAPKIAGLTLSMEEFLTQLRTPREQMDPYPPDLLSDEQALDLYSFLQSQQ